MNVEEALKECPLYNHCVDSFNRIINEPKCKSGNANEYASCERYDKYVAVSVMDSEKLKVLGINFS